MNDRPRSEGSDGSPAGVRGFLPDGEARRRLRKWRGFKDHFARYAVGTFGVGVIIALGLIFVYLFSEVLPMLRPASMEVVEVFEAPGGGEGETLYTTIDRHREVALRYTSNRRVVFFEPRTGAVISTESLPVPEGARVTTFSSAEPRTELVALGLDDGRALLLQHEYNESFVDGGRQFAPDVAYPVMQDGSPLVEIDGDGRAVTVLGVQRSRRGISVAAALADRSLRLVQFEETTSFMTGEVTVRRRAYALPELPAGATATRLLLDITMRNMIVGDDQGRLHYYDISEPSAAERVDSIRVVEGSGPRVTALEYLLGTVSIIVGGSDGSVKQYMLVRDEDNINRLTFVRDYQSHDAAVTTIAPEYIRKGFATAAEDGSVKLHYSTSARTLTSVDVSDRGVPVIGFGARANALMVVDENERFHYLDVNNPHPEVSFKALWGRIWYEGRSQPEYVWQSSSATDEFEPKFSLMPLTLGTLKAAFYAMLFAMPLAVLGAIYSAYFMSPRLRGLVKPSIEVMEALPTVILGFLAGLWLAPFLESNLPSVFAILILMPVFMVLTAYVWSTLLGPWVRARVPAGWEAAILIPVVLLTGWLCIAISPFIEILFFDGDMRQWLTNVGITYDQRNAMVVGIAMGFAVIPTIYSITEDAVFNVPKHLTQGSLALGATPWQTVTKVVLLTASPGIFSAVMIGFGRAVGETMIVLMATGNSPIMNFNIFEGMRTLSANIAVEMPEAAVGGTHYRILFLAALVLFIFTFVLNTAAEVVRDRLRKRYSSL